jgi:hypothetical protein
MSRLEDSAIYLRYEGHPAPYHKLTGTSENKILKKNILTILNKKMNIQIPGEDLSYYRKYS